MSDAPRTVVTVGGPIDETHVTLAVYGEDLDPAAVTALLGCPPTSSHRRGERRGPRSPPYNKGGWFLEVRGTAPQRPEELATTLLDRLPQDESTWARLGELYEVQLRFGLHMTGWNRGFDLSARLVARIAKLRATVVFDIYSYGDEPLPGQPAG